MVGVVEKMAGNKAHESGAQAAHKDQPQGCQQSGAYEGERPKAQDLDTTKKRQGHALLK